MHELNQCSEKEDQTTTGHRLRNNFMPTKPKNEDKSDGRKHFIDWTANPANPRKTSRTMKMLFRLRLEATHFIAFHPKRLDYFHAGDHLLCDAQDIPLEMLQPLRHSFDETTKEPHQPHTQGANDERDNRHANIDHNHRGKDCQNAHGLADDGHDA